VYSSVLFARSELWLLLVAALRQRTPGHCGIPQGEGPCACHVSAAAELGGAPLAEWEGLTLCEPPRRGTVP